MKRIYLDNNASTPLDPSVSDYIKKFLNSSIMNPSSVHFYGQEAKSHLDSARRTVADFFHVKPYEVVFTSSGTESMNMLVKSYLKKNGHIITSEAEHPSVYEILKNYENRTSLSPGIYGAPTLDQVRQAIRSDTKLIALMAVNNETGVKTDIEGIAALARDAKIPFVVDGVSWLGKEAVAIPEGVSAIGFSGHKVHAPAGIGFAIIKTKIDPLIVGGAQEFNLRAGTENLLGIIGLEKALSILKEKQEASTRHMRELRDAFENEVLTRIPGTKINGLGPRVVNTSNICFSEADGETLLIKLDQRGVAASLGSACSSGAIEPSRVLLSMGLSYKDAKSSLRFTFSRMNTMDDVQEAVKILSQC